MPRATRFGTSNRLQKLSYRTAHSRAQLGNDCRAAPVVTEPRPLLPSRTRLTEPQPLFLSRDREGAVLRVVVRRCYRAVTVVTEPRLSDGAATERSGPSRCF